MGECAAVGLSRWTFVCMSQMVWLFVLARFTNRYMSAEEVRRADMGGLGSGLGGRVVAHHSRGAAKG